MTTNRTPVEIARAFIEAWASSDLTTVVERRAAAQHQRALAAAAVRDVARRLRLVADDG